MLCAACDAEHDGDVCPHAEKRRANDPYQDSTRTRIEAETVAAIVAEVTARRDRAAKHRHAPYGDGCDDCGREKALDDLLDWLDDWGKT